MQRKTHNNNKTEPGGVPEVFRGTLKNFKCKFDLTHDNYKRNL